MLGSLTEVVAATPRARSRRAIADASRLVLNEQTNGVFHVTTPRLRFRRLGARNAHTHARAQINDALRRLRVRVLGRFAPFCWWIIILVVGIHEFTIKVNRIIIFCHKHYYN